MFNHDFRQPVSIEDVPPIHRCEWCGKPAVYHFTTLGEKTDNQASFFCQVCGDEFIRTIADTLDRIVTAEVPHSLAA